MWGDGDRGGFFGALHCVESTEDVKGRMRERSRKDAKARKTREVRKGDVDQVRAAKVGQWTLNKEWSRWEDSGQLRESSACQGDLG